MCVHTPRYFYAVCTICVFVLLYQRKLANQAAWELQTLSPYTRTIYFVVCASRTLASTPPPPNPVGAPKAKNHCTVPIILNSKRSRPRLRLPVLGDWGSLCETGCSYDHFFFLKHNMFRTSRLHRGQWSRSQFWTEWYTFYQGRAFMAVFEEVEAES